MTYTEFKKTYSFMVKHFPGTYCFNCGDMFAIVGKCKTEKYIKSGSRWEKVNEETDEISSYNYCNIVDSIPFFKALGGYEKVDCGYTKLGYIPTFINSINPTRTEKITRQFIFN